MKKLITTALVLLVSLFITPNLASATELQSGPMVGFMMSPMTERLILKPGESYTGYFYIMNPEENTIPITYSLKIRGFYRDDSGKAIFEDVAGRSQIVDWITLLVAEENTLDPSESEKVYYTINVPENPPAGGQYAAITATSAPSNENGIIRESVAMNFTIFTEIEGENIRSSEITNLSLPFFLSDGNIVASSKVKNTGNVHGNATYTLKITPLFSNTPAFTNENDPSKKLVLPDRTVEEETIWENTPSVGIFNVYYKVEFEGGETKELSRLVIKCPIWLLITVLIGLSGFIYAATKYFKSKKKAPVSQG